MADEAWENIGKAKMQGLQTYYGHVVSVHAERHLDLSGIGSLLALSSNRDLNALAAKHYRIEFEEKNIYTIRNSQAGKQASEEKSSIQHEGQRLFQEELTRDQMVSLLAEGAEMKTTLWVEEFSCEDYLNPENQAHRIPLFAIDPQENIFTLTPKRELSPEAGWEIMGFAVDRPLGRNQAQEYQ